MAKQYSCPYCSKRTDRAALIKHIDKTHQEILPDGFTSTQVVFNLVNKTTGGKCRVCGDATAWREDIGRYDVLCKNPMCKQKMRDEYKKNMLRVKGTYNILNDPDQQAKMLAGRSISGEYQFQDGGKVMYTGTYEKKCLEFMDVVMQIKSEDIISPGPSMEYIYNGEKHIYIPDFYYVPYNLIIEVKDGGLNPNTKESPGMRSSRERTIEKERMITDKGVYNYIRLTDNNFQQLLEVFMEIKLALTENDPKKIVKVNESVESVIESAFIENKIINSKDLEYNLDKWKPGNKNILFITGLSGSGKSTKAAKLAKENNAINIEIDLFEHNSVVFDENVDNDEGNLIIKEYFEKKFGGPKKFNFSNDKSAAQALYDFIKYCMNYASKHKDKLFIMEGIQLADLEMANELKDYPVIIVGTSIINSMYRAAKREGIVDYFKSFKTYGHFVEWFQWYLTMDKNNKKFAKELSEAIILQDEQEKILENINEFQAREINSGKRVPKSISLYHGSPVQGLKFIEPRECQSYKGSWVFVSPDIRFAACYGAFWHDGIASQGSWDNWQTVVMGISDKVEMNKPCSLYEVENDGSFIDFRSGFKEAVSNHRARVIKETKFNSYTEMLEYYGVKVVSYDKYKRGVKTGYLEESQTEFWFYHLVPKDADMSLGITSLEWQYRNDIKAFRKNSDKYRERLCKGWNIYPNKIPSQLTDKEVHDGINAFRKTQNGCNQIYLFRYPPNHKMGKQMSEILAAKDIYAVDIDMLRQDGIISDIDFGYVDSNTDNKKLTEEWYRKISKRDYFKNYSENDPNRLLFSYMNHISITPVNGYIPKEYIIRVPNINMERSIVEQVFYDAKNKSKTERLYGFLKQRLPEDRSSVIESVTLDNEQLFLMESKKEGNFIYLDLIKDRSEVERYSKETKMIAKYDQYAGDYNGEVIVDTDKDIVAGQILIGNKKDKGFITDLFINHQCRNNGLGGKLIDDAVKKYGGVDLTVKKDNEVAIRMYKKRGFVIIGDGNNKNEWYMKLKSKLTKDEKPIKESARELQVFYEGADRVKTERFYELLKQRLAEDDKPVKQEVPLSDVNEDNIKDAFNSVIHTIIWCRMDSSAFACFREYKTPVMLDNTSFVAGEFTGNDECINEIIETINKNSLFKHGRYEAQLLFINEPEGNKLPALKITIKELWSYITVKESGSVIKANTSTDLEWFMKSDFSYKDLLPEDKREDEEEESDLDSVALDDEIWD